MAIIPNRPLMMENNNAKMYKAGAKSIGWFKGLPHGLGFCFAANARNRLFYSTLFPRALITPMHGDARFGHEIPSLITRFGDEI